MPGKPLPKIRILFHYGAHGTAEDAKHIEKLLKEFKPHIYAGEGAMDNGEAEHNESIELARKYARAKRELLSQMREGDDTFHEKEMEGIVNVPGLWMTTMEKMGWLKKLASRIHKKTASFYANRWQTAFFNGNFERALKNYHHEEKAISRRSALRESQIVRNCEKIAREAIKRRPELAKEGEIRVYVKLGQLHRATYAELKRRGTVQVERAYDYSPVIPAKGATIRALHRKKRQDILNPKYRLLLARDMIGDVIGEVSPTMENTNLRLLAIDAITGNFSEEDVRGLCEEVGKAEAGTEEESRKVLREIVEKKFREKGIQPLTGPQEAMRIVRRHYGKIDFSKPFWLGRKQKSL
ncbi:TPA: hypothetical protein HA244_04650 [Candidatus Micrarchaeota archaeon]|nr:hypothetical protein [Candidatus Micrarchaeota archaeon]